MELEVLTKKEIGSILESLELHDKGKLRVIVGRKAVSPSISGIVRFPKDSMVKASIVVWVSIVVLEILLLNVLAGATDGSFTPANENTINNGLVLWIGNCRTCHESQRTLTILGIGNPNDLMPSKLSVMNEAAFTIAVRDGRKKMPSFPNLSEKQIIELKAYLANTSFAR